MNEFTKRVRQDQQRRGLIPKDPMPPASAASPETSQAIRRVEQLEAEPRSSFMPVKLVLIAVWGVICLLAFLAAPGVGAAGAALGLFYAVLSGTFERRPSQPVLFDIERLLRRR